MKIYLYTEEVKCASSYSKTRTLRTPTQLRIQQTN
jgi:hypothetical protein